MANNVLPSGVAAAGGAGLDVATDQTGGATGPHYQYVKLADGTEDSTQVIPGGALGLNVQVSGNQPAATTGTITTATSTVAVPVTGMGGATISIKGTYAGVSVVFECSDDGGTTYFPMQVQREADGVPLTADTLATNASVMYLVDLPGVTHFRVRATAWTSGTATVRVSPGGMPFLPVVSIGNSTSATGTTTSVASTVTTNTTILAANVGRRGATVFNDSTQTLFLLLGAGTESTTVFTTKLPAGAYYETPFGFTGRLSGHWVAANGSARITEFTA